MELTAVELMYIDTMFNEGGYVLDFSDDTFAKFVTKSVGVDIKSRYGLSKGKSLNAYFSDNTISIKDKMKLLKDLIDYYEVYKIKSFRFGFKNADDPSIAVMLKQNKQNCINILNKYSGIVISTDTNSVQEKGLKELIDEAQAYYKKDKKIATEKMWDAFERLKTYYMKDGLDKKKSVEKIIEQISHSNEIYYEFFNEEFIKLTDLGNKHRIRHHELDKIEIIDDNYYDYFYNRCLALIDLALKFLV